MSELCADAMWLPSEKKKRIKEMFELPEPKDAKEALTEITGETRMPVEFRPCLDCGCDKYPFFDGSTIHLGGGVQIRQVIASCKRCGWETNIHNNVKECAKEWNEAEV